MKRIKNIRARSVAKEINDATSVHDLKVLFALQVFAEAAFKFKSRIVAIDAMKARFGIFTPLDWTAVADVVSGHLGSFESRRRRRKSYLAVG